MSRFSLGGMAFALAVFLALGGVDIGWGAVNEGWLIYGLATMLLLPMFILAGSLCGLGVYGLARAFTNRFASPSRRGVIALNVYLIGSCMALLAGSIVNDLTWRYHWPVLTPDWLAHLLSADGEAGYDSLAVEYMIDVWLVFTATVLLLRRTRHLR